MYEDSAILLACAGFLPEVTSQNLNRRTFRLPQTESGMLQDGKINCRILYLVGQLGPGGLERQLYSLLNGVDRRRYSPAVAVWNFSETDVYVPQIRSLGVPLYPLPRPFSAAAKLRNFRRLVVELKPEIVHSYSFYLNFGAFWAARNTNIIDIGSTRGDFLLDKRSNGFWLNKLSARWPRVQIVNSHAAADNVRRSSGFFVPAASYVVRNGLDLQRFQNFPLSTKGKFCIVGVGSLIPVKRWDRLLRAALALKIKGCDFEIQIAGSGPLRNILERQAQEYGLVDCVHFLGHYDDIPRLLSQATVLAHTSDSEGCPNVVIEAMACGRAVVATDVGDIPNLVDDSKTGFVVHRDDEADFVDRLETLSKNRNLCQQMGEAARAKAEQEFGLDRLVDETLAAYRALGWQDS
jgi:glycosyltransferase involved in cell wall biosynthesis